MPGARRALGPHDDARDPRASPFSRPASGFRRAALRIAVVAMLAAPMLAPARGCALSLHRPAGAAPAPQAQPFRPGLIPHGRVAIGARDIAEAWLASPTARYPHAVLGDALEAAQLVVAMRDGRQHAFELGPSRVFEDLEPRLVDLDGDGRDEVLVVESDLREGAALAVYGVGPRGLERRAATGFIGQPNRWLNPLGAGDFDGDGRLDLALVATPHIGGILRLYRYQEGTLLAFAERRGVSTHRIGSTELALGRVVGAKPRDRMLLPDRSMTRLLLLEWTPQGIVECDRLDLGAPLHSALVPVGPNRWGLTLEDGTRYEVSAR